MTATFPSCDGIRRRDLLKIGAAGTLGFSLSLPALLERRAAAAQSQASRGARPARDVSLLIIYLQGGMSTIDVFDLKPEAPPNFAAISGRSRPRLPGCKSANICRRWPGRGTNSRSCALSRIITRGMARPIITC